MLICKYLIQVLSDRKRVSIAYTQKYMILCTNFICICIYIYVHACDYASNEFINCVPICDSAKSNTSESSMTNFAKRLKKAEIKTKTKRGI